MVEKIFVFLVSPFFISWGIWYYWKFVNRKKEKPVNAVTSKPLPPLVLGAPPVAVLDKKPPFEIVNRRQRRAMEKIKREGQKKYLPKKRRDELRAGKIIDANDFLKQYFDNGKK